MRLNHFSIFHFLFGDIRDWTKDPKNATMPTRIFLFSDRVSQCSPSCHDGHELTEIHSPVSAPKFWD